MTLASLRVPFRPRRRHNLEAAYRRLLHWYPPAYRDRHEDEMLGILMAMSRPGQRRPGARESLDLLWAALRIRVRMFLRGADRPQWASALALTAVLLPLLMVVMKFTEFLCQGSQTGFGTPIDILVGDYGFAGEFTRSFQLNSYSIALTGNITSALTAGPGPWLILAALACAGWRRTAAGFAIAVSVAYAVLAQTHGYFMLGDPRAVGELYLYGLEALVLLAAPATPRGWRALQWRPAAALAVAAGALSIATSGGIQQLLPSKPYHFRAAFFHRPATRTGLLGFIDRLFGVDGSTWSHWLLYQGTLVLVILAALAFAWVYSPASRRMLILLGIPLFFYVANWLCNEIQSALPGLDGRTVSALPLLLLLAAAAAVVLTHTGSGGADNSGPPTAPGSA